MHAPLTQPRRKTRWTYAEYYRMAEMGFFRDQKVELIDGEIIEIPPQGEDHGVGILLVTRAMNLAFGSGHVVRVQLPLHTGKDQEPERISQSSREIFATPFDMGGQTAPYWSWKSPAQR
jgi:hypothetical protein